MILLNRMLREMGTDENMDENNGRVWEGRSGPGNSVILDNPGFQEQVAKAGEFLNELLSKRGAPGSEKELGNGVAENGAAHIETIENIENHDLDHNVPDSIQTDGLSGLPPDFTMMLGSDFYTKILKKNLFSPFFHQVFEIFSKIHL